MKTVLADINKSVYDPATDVMSFALGTSRYTDEEEVSPGIHVLYAYDNGRLDEVVGVEVEYYLERFGDMDRIEILVGTSWVLCVPDAAGHAK